MKEQRDSWIERLVNDNRKPLLKYIKRYTGSLEDAEDILQDVFLNCYRHADNFDASRCSEQAWLYIITKNRLKNYYRDKHVDVSISAMESGEADYLLGGEAYVDEAIRVMECREQVAKLLESLDERSREILILRFFEDLSHAEIAPLLNISEQNVRVIQSRAIKKMAAMTANFDGGQLRYLTA